MRCEIVFFRNICTAPFVWYGFIIAQAQAFVQCEKAIAGDSLRLSLRACSKEIPPQLCSTFRAAPADCLPQNLAVFIRNIEKNAVALSPAVENVPLSVQFKAAFLAGFCAAQQFCAVCNLLCYALHKSFTTSPAMISPTTDGTNAVLPGISRRSVHLCCAPGGQMQCVRQEIDISSIGRVGVSSEYTTLSFLTLRLRHSIRMTFASGQTFVL